MSNKEHSASLLFQATACLYLLAGMSMGVFVAFKFLMPELGEHPYLTFGRMRMVHTNIVLFGFLLQADIGLMLYIVPRLLHTRLFSEKLAWATWAVYNAGVAGGLAGLVAGHNQPVEYAEIAPPFNYLVTGAWVLLAVNIIATLFQRRVRTFYVSVWYAAGTLLWTSVVYITGSILAPQFAAGLNQANLSWFYVHNAVGLVFTPAGLVIAYYVIPKALNTPLFSHKLSLVGFWVIAFTYCWTGAHHMIHGPNSYWLETVAIVFSFSLLIPVLAVITNFFGTYALAPRPERFRSAEAKLLFLGTVYYLLTCLQGPFQSIRAVNILVSKTDWVIAHAHMAVLGCFALYAMAGITYVIPRIVNRPLYSPRLANVHFWLTFAGLLFFLFPMYVSGPLQGLAWLDVSRTFLEILAQQRVVWTIRLASGALILSAQLLFVYNIWETLVGRSRDASNPAAGGGAP